MRRVRTACEQAFEEGTYRLERLCLSPADPSGADLLPSGLFSDKGASRYFTYKVRTPEDREPDFSGMSRRDIGLVRRYLRRSADVPHHGREVICSVAAEETVESAPARG